MIAKIKNYVNEVSKEMKKVSWPTRQQLRESTVVVVSTTLIITVLTYLIDLVFSKVIGLLF